jgi:uncharacterized protein YneF (UPF0154 family)
MTEKKGLGPLAWIAIGCAGLVLIAMIVFVMGGMFVAKKAGELVEEFEDNPAAAAAEMMVKVNPELELVESDREAGTITVRNKKDGQIVTVNYEDLEKGRISFETEEGDVTVGLTGEGEAAALTVTKDGEETMRIGGGEAPSDLPDWVPVYPDAELEGTFSATSEESLTGSFRFEVSDSVDEVMAFYADRLEAKGWTVRRSDYSGPESKGGQLTATRDNQGVTVMVSSTTSGAETVVNYNQGN